MASLCLRTESSQSIAAFEAALGRERLIRRNWKVYRVKLARSMALWVHRSIWLGPSIVALILGLLVLLFSSGRLRRVYQRRIEGSTRERPFLASLGFFVTVAVVRTITIAIHHHLPLFHDVEMNGRHIHHMVWGILLLLAVGYSWLLGFGTRVPTDGVGRFTSMLYGVASALILDEFALWLNLKDVYWQREGRESVEAMVMFASLLAMTVFGASLFRGLWRELSCAFGADRAT